MGLIVGLLSAIGIILTWGAIREPMRFRRFKMHGSRKLRMKSNKVPADLWPDVVDDLASAIRAGLSLPQAVIELCNSGPEQLRPAFQMCRDQYQATGDFNAGLNLIAQNLEEPQADSLLHLFKLLMRLEVLILEYCYARYRKLCGRN